MSNQKLTALLEDYIFHIDKVVNYSNNTISSYKRDLNSFIIYLSYVITKWFKIKEYYRKY